MAHGLKQKPQRMSGPQPFGNHWVGSAGAWIATVEHICTDIGVVTARTETECERKACAAARSLCPACRAERDTAQN